MTLSVKIKWHAFRENIHNLICVLLHCRLSFAFTWRRLYSEDIPNQHTHRKREERKPPIQIFRPFTPSHRHPTPGFLVYSTYTQWTYEPNIFCESFRILSISIMSTNFFFSLWFSSFFHFLLLLLWFRFFLLAPRPFLLSLPPLSRSPSFAISLTCIFHSYLVCHIQWHHRCRKIAKKLI